MMRLLKYDWKRNSTTLLGAFAILLIVQIAITVTGSIRDWELGVMFGLSMLAYGSVGVLLLVVAGKNFGYNIKAYHRRLLPVRSVWNVASSLILACVSLLVLGILMAVHLWYYWSSAGIWGNINLADVPVSYYVGLALLMVWKFIYLMIAIFFAITVASSITKKGSTWIGILVFFVLQYVLGWLSQVLFGEEAAWVGPMASISFYEKEADITVSTVQYTLAWGALAFEVVLAALILYATVYLIDRKVEV
ncbi:hypothetical protein OHJ21_32080 [Virgibacillus sp. LDC1]|uniref:hypothetical protein n=1 Tax=Paenibacillus TaxID=44249 RepID=UPI000C271294|nr:MULTISPECIES: hypothetical protein [Paenibacillus]MCV4235813.1 hypothetical protein [Virgibacillus sp. LDC1]MEC0311235.1 hypothetical protein [Paenibacillus lautus]PJN48356.1 hypothetical protein PAEVO_65720 [Paenibacillus sp. GM2FR]